MEKKKRKDKTTIKQIADYWIINSNISELELNIDWADAHTHCWNCGDDKKRGAKKTASLERCHIIPNALEGEDIPSNYVLLCNGCHAEAPNTSDKDDMWDWIKSNYMPMSFYGTYKIRKALVMYKEKEGHSFFDKLINIENPIEVVTEEFKKIGTHGATFTISSYYYMLKTIVKNAEEKKI